MVFQYFRSNRKDLVQNLKRCNNNVIHGKQAVDRKYMVHTLKVSIAIGHLTFLH